MNDNIIIFILYILFVSLIVWQHKGHIKDLRGYRDFWMKRYYEEVDQCNMFRKAIIQARDITQICRDCGNIIEGRFGTECRRCRAAEDIKAEVDNLIGRKAPQSE